MSVEFDRESPGKFDSRTLNRKALNRRTGRSLLGARRRCLLSFSRGQCGREPNVL